MSAFVRSFVRSFVSFFVDRFCFKLNESFKINPPAGSRSLTANRRVNPSPRSRRLVG